MKHFKRDWFETIGEGETDTWGTSVYYLETDDELNVVRQIQVFEKGQVLKYEFDFLEDEFGGLADQPLDEDDFKSFLITELEFTETWKNLNRKTK